MEIAQKNTVITLLIIILESTAKIRILALRFQVKLQ